MCRAQWSEWQEAYAPRPRPRHPPEITTLTARSITYLGSETQIDIQRERNRIVLRDRKATLLQCGRSDLEGQA